MEKKKELNFFIDMYIAVIVFDKESNRKGIIGT
jgi:hypothetical protein